MLAINGNIKIFCRKNPTDLRKGFEGLSWIVENEFNQDVTCGAYFIFLNRSRDRMKVLYWDADGLAIWYKRLEKGSFSKCGLDKINMDRREFFMLLEGIIPRKLKKRFKIG